MISVFELFKIGIGPSSSHTMGPMRAAATFAGELASGGRLGEVARVTVDLYGSLALTGIGHGTDRAVVLGLEGETPELIDVETMSTRLAAIRASRRLRLHGLHAVTFDEAADLRFHRAEVLPFHPNGMRFTALDAAGTALLTHERYSIGGGFVASGPLDTRSTPTAVPFPFRTGAELLTMAAAASLTIAGVVRANEGALHPGRDIDAALLEIWRVMKDCAERGMRTGGELPGALRVKRRAAGLARKQRHEGSGDPLQVLDWVTVWAMAVNEENAAGGRVVTAPTNGAAGLLPAVLHYYERDIPGASASGVCTFLLTAAAIGILCKTNASISGAEIGCQGEVGVACAMAAAGLVAAQGGSNAQIEHAAEIGIEHHLGMTCDPVGGLVQVPCIERNAIASVKAINAARLALHGDGSHKVSLDKAIKTMRDTGADMKTKYKETSRGGLAVNVIEC